MKKKHMIISILTVSLLALCLLLASCGSDKDKTSKKEPSASQEETSREPQATEKTEDEQKADDQDKAEKEADAKKDEAKQDEQAKSDAEKSADKKSNSKTSKKAAKKVWVEPVYETVTVESNTGTTYCHGANSGGGCGASWHGTKESTYQSWKSHWQAYVKRRTAEEAAKGKTYVCDHIHDDCRWVPDPPKQEKVLVKEGYWKTVK